MYVPNAKALCMLMIISLGALALGLAMDAFAVAVAQGAGGKSDLRDALRIGGAFGAAQAIMPFFGWALGSAFVAQLREIDHWIALLLLGFLGIRMLREAMRAAAAETTGRLAGWGLLTAAVATSVDALAAGLTLPTLGAPIFLACAAIGAVTALLSAGGVFIGGIASARIGKQAEIAGGVILIGLGIKIFVEHQFFGV